MKLRKLWLAWSVTALASLNMTAATQAIGEELIRPAKLLVLTNPGDKSMRTFPAEVKASSRTELAFRVAGELIELAVREGEEVEKGQLLARLDPTDYEVTLQRYQAEYKLANQQFQRIKTMLKRKLVSQSQYDEKSAELSIKKANLKQARLNRQYTEIHAPYAGQISQSLVENFQNLQAKEPVLVLQSNDELEIEFQLPESIISLETLPGAEESLADVTFDANSSEVFKAKYFERTAEADPATGAYTITMKMPRPASLQIYPGMSASVSVDLSKVFVINANGFVLPVEAIISSDDQPVDSHLRQVWKVNPDDMAVYRADVTVGSLTAKGLQIESGLEAGDIIVTAGANYLREGMKVRPLTRERGL